jgi:outer membrane receptor protein involved in Fe transport
VLLDGVPLNDPTTGEVDLASLPVEQIERVTIVRGGAAARYGARALAGVIAIERRHPTVTEGWLSLGAGEWGERIARGAVSLVRERGEHTLAGSLSGGLNQFAGDFDYEVPPVRGGGTAERENGDGSNNSLLGTFRLSGRRSVAEIRADYLDVDRGLPGSIVNRLRSAPGGASDRYGTFHAATGSPIGADVNGLNATCATPIPRPRRPRRTTTRYGASSGLAVQGLRCAAPSISVRFQWRVSASRDVMRPPTVLWDGWGERRAAARPGASGIRRGRA